MSQVSRGGHVGSGIALPGQFAGDGAANAHPGLHQHHHHQAGDAVEVYPEEPPPSYNDIFPEGYQYTKTEADDEGISEVGPHQSLGVDDGSAGVMASDASTARDPVSSV